MSPTLLQGDCFEVLQTFDECSVDACVTDPPYGLNFMGKHWDKGVPDADVWRQVYRVLKPGAHLLSFFGTRTYHRGVVAIEDAGFEIRDQIGWLYGSGFPKSLDVSKAIDKAAGAERETTAPATDAARQWQGWGTALKPAWEPIVVARKPLDGTVASNVLAHGTGGINVDGCRVQAVDGTTTARKRSLVDDTAATFGKGFAMGGDGSPLGRFPANIIHDGSDEVLAEFAKYGERTSGAMRPTYVRNTDRSAYGDDAATGYTTGDYPGDSGTAARFFKSCEETDEEWLDQNLRLSVASIAGSSLCLSNQAVVSALNHAVTWALPVGAMTCILSQAPTTNATPKELRRIAEAATEAIPNIVRKFLLEQEPIKRFETQSRVSVVASATRTNIMMITIDRWRSDGSADPVTFSITETSLDRGDRASQSRIHYTAKASKDDRNDGLHEYEHTDAADMVDREPGSDGMNSPRAGAGRTSGAKNHHPTVKPTSLMRYLVRLVTPKGGLVLDPFAGSGTTLIAAYREDCRAIGIELDPGYHKMASHRIDKATAQGKLPL